MGVGVQFGGLIRPQGDQPPLAHVICKRHCNSFLHAGRPHHHAVASIHMLHRKYISGATEQCVNDRANDVAVRFHFVLYLCPPALHYRSLGSRVFVQVFV